MIRLLCLTGLLLLFLGGCSNLDEGDEILYLKTDNSYLPVYVRGNPDADTYIVWTHGGPGSSGLYYGDIPEIEVLHRDYRVVYWDQLGSGGSTGNPDESDYNMEEFSSHLEGVINIVQNRYNPPGMFLLGHSWGGFLASWYLVAEGDTTASAQRQAELDGLILLNPVLDIERAIEEGIVYIRGDGVTPGYAREQIDAGIDVQKWEDALAWYDDHVKDGLLYGRDVATHYGFIEDAGGMLVQRDRNDELVWELGIDMIFLSPFQFYDYYSNQNTIRTYLDIADKTLADTGGPNVSSLALPWLLMAGEDDKIANIDMNDDWAALMGWVDSSDPDQVYTTYENCAHAAFLDRPESISVDLINFIISH